MSLSDQLMNPRKHAIKKWLFDILQERYPKHDALVDRVGHYLVTSKDMDDFTKLVADLFEVGYLKCLNEYRDKLKSHGLSVKIKHPTAD